MKKQILKEPIFVQVPDNFDALSLANKCRNGKGDVQLLADRLNWFVYQIVKAPFRQDSRKKMEETGYVLLSTIRFDDFFRSRSTTEEVINILCEHVLDRNDSYQTNNYSKGYRLKPEYLTGEMNWVEIISDSMNKYIRDYFSVKEKQQISIMSPIQPVVKFLTDPGLQLDIKKAHSFLEFWSHDLKRKIQDETQDWDSELITELTHRAITRIYYQKHILRSLINGHRPEPVRDTSGLRLHSVYTALKSPLRNFLTYKGQRLASVDLKASQPYLLNRLLQTDFWQQKSAQTKPNPHNLPNLHPELYKKLSKTKSMDTIIMFTQSAETYSGKGLQGKPFVFRMTSMNCRTPGKYSSKGIRYEFSPLISGSKNKSML